MNCVVDLLDAFAPHTCVPNVTRQLGFDPASFPPDHSPKRVCNAIPAYPGHRAQDLGLRSYFYGAMGMQVHANRAARLSTRVSRQTHGGVSRSELSGEIP